MDGEKERERDREKGEAREGEEASEWTKGDKKLLRSRAGGVAGRAAEEEQRESARAHSSPSVDTIVDIFLMFSLIIIFRNPPALRDDTERFEM